jgi:hypothetical protein
MENLTMAKHAAKSQKSLFEQETPEMQPITVTTPF